MSASINLSGVNKSGCSFAESSDYGWLKTSRSLETKQAFSKIKDQDLLFFIEQFKVTLI